MHVTADDVDLHRGGLREMLAQHAVQFLEALVDHRMADRIRPGQAPQRRDSLEDGDRIEHRHRRSGRRRPAGVAGGLVMGAATGGLSSPPARWRDSRSGNGAAQSPRAPARARSRQTCAARSIRRPAISGWAMTNSRFASNLRTCAAACAGGKCHSASSADVRAQATSPSRQPATAAAAGIVPIFASARSASRPVASSGMFQQRDHRAARRRRRRRRAH